MESVKPANFYERSHTDSLGRKWGFVQRGKLGKAYNHTHPWNQGKLMWVCTVCGGEEPIKYESIVHDEVIVPDPTEQLDRHDCDLTRVDQVMES